jgi:predicted dehydrogenase
LIGCGNWGRHVLRDLVNFGCEVVVVAVSPDSVANATAGNANHIVATIAQLGPTDGVVVVTPATTHVEVIEEVLQRWPGVPIYSEKPLTTDVDEAHRVARTHADRVFVMHKWRYHPGVLALAEIARSGELGPIVGLQLTREQWGFPVRDVDPIWTHLPHVLSIVLEVLGSIPQPVSARFDHAGDELTGISAMLGTYPWVAVHDSVRGRDKRRECRLYCERGVVHLADSYSDAIEILTGPIIGSKEPRSERRAISDKLPLAAQLEAFLDFIRGGGPAPKGSLAEETAILDAIRALRRLAGE